MNTIKDYNKYIIDINAYHKGMQVVFQFDNGYGLSVVSHAFSYGNDDELFEIGVLKFHPDGTYDLTYETPIYGDVLGHQSKEDLLKVIEQAINL
jgi:hypothetical protein